MSMPPPPPPIPPGGAYLPPTGPAAGGNLASPGIRIGARLVDGIILGVINMVIGGIVLSGNRTGFAGFGSGDDVSAGTLFVAGLIGMVIGFLYEAVLTAMKGGTPMKLAFGLRVVDASTGQPVALPQSAIRWAVPGLIGIIPSLGGLIVFVLMIVSLVLLFTDKLHQTISDKAAKTVVVRTR